LLRDRVIGDHFLRIEDHIHYPFRSTSFQNTFRGRAYELLSRLVASSTVDLEKKLKDADLVITGEGGMDRQTIFGKTPFGVAQVAKKYNIPVIGIAGNLGSGYEILYDNGFDAIFSIMPGVRTLEVALASGSVNVENTVRNIFKAMKSIKLK